MKIKITATEIKDVNELNSHYQSMLSSNAMEFVGNSVNTDWSTLWTKRHDYVRPGQKGDVIALLFRCTVTQTELSEMDLTNALFSFFNDEHQEENVLSFRMSKTPGTVNIETVVFPLNFRVLDASKWVVDGNLDYEYHIRLCKRLSDSFQEKVEDESLSKDKAAFDKEIKVAAPAQVNLIADMNIAEDKLIHDEELIYDAAGLSKQVHTDTSFEKVNAIFATVLKYFTVGSERMMFKNAQLGEIKPQKFAEAVYMHLGKYYAELSENDKQVIIDRVIVGVYGNYILEELINDERISDIKVIAPDKIRVKVNGKRMTSNLNFIDIDDYVRFINGLAIRNQLDLQSEAIHFFTDKYTNPKFIMRFNITTSYINSVPYPYLHIRKIRKDKYSLDDLVRLQMLDRKTADYLKVRVKEGKGIILTGKGASGKTNLLNALLEEIPYGCSGLIIQESEELFTKKHPDIMVQHVAGKQYSLKEEARNGLLTDLDYFVIGEIKGEEALWFLNAAATGHKCWCTVHSASAEDAIDKLADYVMYESKYDKDQALYMLKELDTIVFLDHFKVSQISEITGWDNEKNNLAYKTVYKR